MFHMGYLFRQAVSLINYGIPHIIELIQKKSTYIYFYTWGIWRLISFKNYGIHHIIEPLQKNLPTYTFISGEFGD